MGSSSLIIWATKLVIATYGGGLRFILPSAADSIVSASHKKCRRTPQVCMKSVCGFASRCSLLDSLRLENPTMHGHAVSRLDSGVFPNFPWINMAIINSVAVNGSGCLSNREIMKLRALRIVITLNSKRYQAVGHHRGLGPESALSTRSSVNRISTFGFSPEQIRSLTKLISDTVAVFERHFASPIPTHQSSIFVAVPPIYQNHERNLKTRN